MSEPGSAVVRTPRRWPLYLSLFINVVLITAIAIGAWRLMQWRDAPMGMGPWMPRHVERSLPEGARDKVKAIREKHAGVFRPLFADVRAAREGIRSAIDAEPFSPEALTAALTEMRRADQAVAEATATIIVEIASVLTPEERRLVRKAFREKMKERRAGGDRLREPEPGEPPMGPMPGTLPLPEDGAPPPPDGPPPPDVP